ncbi:MAG: hypothetical protein ACTSPG_00035 [Candidatus Hodarchaeales archaeon]
MTIQDEVFSLDKKEIKLYSCLITYGVQTKDELCLNSDIPIDDAEKAIDTLIEKGLARYDKDNGVVFSTLPIQSLISALDYSSQKLEEGLKKDYQSVKKAFEKNLLEFKETYDKQFEELKSTTNTLRESLKEEWENSERLRREKTKEFAEELVTSTVNKTANIHTNFEQLITSEKNSLEKEWNKAITHFKNIPETSVRTLKEYISIYEKELLEIIKASSSKINAIQTQISEIITTIETESSIQLQAFVSDTDSSVKDLKNNILDGMNEVHKYEKEFVNDLRKRMQETLESEISNALTKVVSAISDDIDKEINTALDKVKEQTKESIEESSNQIKQEFKDFVETASELIQEQKASIDVIHNEIIDISSEQKLVVQKEFFLKQFEAHLSSDLAALETKYRRVQKIATDAMETVRRDAKSRLIEQRERFDALIKSFNEKLEKAIERKDMDVIRLQQLSQSVDQFLSNLLVSIPARVNQLKSSLEDSFVSSTNELKETLGKTPLDSINEIYSSLDLTQKRIDDVIKETSSDSKLEIQSVIETSNQITDTLTNLQEGLMEKVHNRFEQRSKVLNTELDALLRNFQQVLSGIESSYSDLKDRLQSENISTVTEIETNLQNSTVQLKNEISNIFNENKKRNRDFITNIDSTLNNHMDRILDVIKEGFSQIKTEFNNELEKQLENIHQNNQTYSDALQNAIDDFTAQSTTFISNFKSNLSQSIEDKQNVINTLINDNRRSVEEVVALHRSQIAKYQEKGPNDIMMFINQVESEVSTQNKSLKDALEELASFYDGLYDSTMNEVNGLIKQVHETGEKLTTIVNSSLQSITTTLSKAKDNVDSFVNDSVTELENQIGVASGFITSEFETTAQVVEEEAQALKGEMQGTISDLNSELKDMIVQQDQEYQSKIPEVSQEFSQAFEELIKERHRLDQELEVKAQESLSNLLESWSNQMERTKAKLQEVTESINLAIKANIENLEVIVEKNTEQSIKRLNEVINIESVDDLFGLNEIRSKVKQANKRLRIAISDTLKEHLEEFDHKVPELMNSYAAIHAQAEEDLVKFMEDLNDTISSYQSTFNNKLHEFLTEERQSLDFSEIRDELTNITRDFNESANKSLEEISNDLSDSIQTSMKNIDQSKEEIQTLLGKLSAIISEENLKLQDELNKLKDEMYTEIETKIEDLKKKVERNVDSHYNALEKTSLSIAGNSSQLLQVLREEMDKLISEIAETSNNLFNEVLESNKGLKDDLQVLESELTQAEPIKTVRFLKLASDETKSRFVFDIIKDSKKQVTIFSSNPTFLNSSELKSVPSGKRVYLITNFDFTKKGKKWLSELKGKVNVIFYSTSLKNLKGLFLVADNDIALLVPNELGIVASDQKLVQFLSQTLQSTRGRRLSLKSLE